MKVLPYTLTPDDMLPPALGLIVLQVDETLEPEIKADFAGSQAALYVSRIASAEKVSTDSLTAMADSIAASAALLPATLHYDAVGYGCTSASAVIGSEKVCDMIRQGCRAKHVTDPLRAAIAYARHLNLSRLALLSPYVAEVNQPLRAAFATAGINTDVFGSFAEAEEAKVARISTESIVQGALSLVQSSDIDGIFLSCTNLKTRAAIPLIAAELNLPVFSSNSALSWHMKRLADA